MKSSRDSISIILGLVWIAAAILTLTVGETDWNTIWNGAVQRFHGQSLLWNPLLDERIPRLIVLSCTGAALAVAGAVTQSLFRNPLASPSVLGITCGGHLSAILVFILGWHISYPYLVPLSAFIGCLTTLLIIYAVSRKNGRIHLTNLILNGIAFSTVILAVQKTFLYALRDHWHLIQMISEWEAGSTTALSWQHVHMQLPLTIVGLAGCWRYMEEINLLALGDEEALNLGVNTGKIQWRLFLLIALLTGGALAAVGSLSFFCLILPHAVRKLRGSNNNVLIPLSALAGGTALLGLDVLLRLLDIRSFTIGSVSATLGGLFFLILLFREHSSQQTLGDPYRC